MAAVFKNGNLVRTDFFRLGFYYYDLQQRRGRGGSICRFLPAGDGYGIQRVHSAGNLLFYWAVPWDYDIFQPYGAQENHP